MLFRSYLAERDCRQLTRNLFRRLAPGGRLLLGGAMPGDPGLGFREVFMNWPMQARDRERMLDFARGIARAEIAHRLDNHAQLCAAPRIVSR